MKNFKPFFSNNRHQRFWSNDNFGIMFLAYGKLYQCDL
jgi:hypothetical protein